MVDSTRVVFFSPSFVCVLKSSLRDFDTNMAKQPLLRTTVREIYSHMPPSYRTSIFNVGVLTFRLIKYPLTSHNPKQPNEYNNDTSNTFRDTWRWLFFFFLSITHVHSRHTVRNRRTTLINVVRNTWSGYVQSVLRVIAWRLRCVHNPNITSEKSESTNCNVIFNCRKKFVDITWPHFSKNESLNRRSQVEALLPLLRRLGFFFFCCYRCFFFYGFWRTTANLYWCTPPPTVSEYVVS